MVTVNEEAVATVLHDEVGISLLILVVIAMNLHENLLQIINGADDATLQITHHAIQLTLRSKHSHHIHPTTAIALFSVGSVILETTVKEELEHQIIILDAFQQGGTFHLAAMISEHLRILRIFLQEVFKDGLAIENRLHDIRIRKGEIDDVIARTERTLITFRPFAHIAPCAHGADVDARHQCRLTPFSNDITEGEFLHLRVVLHLTHHHGETANMGRPENVTSRSRLAATIQCAPVDGTHFVGMVTLVGARTGIVEREGTANEKGALVMTCGERTTEGCTRLAIVHIAIGKEDARLGREALTHMHRLTDKAAIHLCAINDTGTSSHDAVFDDDIRAYERACIVGAENRAIGQFAAALHFTPLANAHIIHLLHAHHTRTRPNVGS